MNYVYHLNQFLKKVENQETARPTHISLYLSLFHLWNQHHFQNPIAATRVELMHVSKISAKNTFYKCLKDLVDWEWIEYTPASSIYKGASFRIIPFSSGSKNEPSDRLGSETSRENGDETSTAPGGGSVVGTVVGSEVVSYIQTNTNLLNLKNNKPIFKNLKNYNEEL